jgi:lipopolysaccharide export LptBFGC system permease protein LptF
MEQAIALQAIQAILAPALGISAVGLLLLGLNTRYSNIINRIRLLNDERRRYTRMISDNKELSYTDKTRHMSIRSQTDRLLVRTKLVRNAILSLQLAVGLFVVTSVMIGMNFFFPMSSPNSVTLLVFIAGMICVLAAVANAALEVLRSYKIVLIDVNAEE